MTSRPLTSGRPSAPPAFNPWPAAIIAFFSLAITGMVTFVIFAARNQMELVRPDYYEEEIRFQQQLDRLNRTQAVKGRMRVAYDWKEKRVTLALPPAHANRATSGRVYFYRPSNAQLDQQVPLAINDQGIQHLDVRSFRAGLWKMRVYWTADQHEYFLDETIVLPPDRI
jgi:nitrogen fixation protein FixH